MDARVENASIMARDDENEATESQSRIVKVTHAALDEREGEIVLRGVIAPDCLHLLKVDDYQREVLRPVTSSRKPSSLKSAVTEGRTLPDVVLGMRGEKFSSRGGTFLLEDNVYIIDGLQRISTVRDFNDMHPEQPSKTQIGAMIHFNTTKQGEKEKFAILNANRTPMSPNVMLRNVRDEYTSVLTLYGLSHTDKEFVLHGRVSWQQYAARGHLLSALTLARVVGTLHKHVQSASPKATKTRVAGAAGGIGANSRALPQALENVIKTLGLRHFRDNIKTFFEIVDDCYGLRAIEYRELSVQTKGNFLITLAAVMSGHSNFWKDGAGTVLQVDTDMRRRLKNFPIHDPGIERLAGGGASVIPLMFNMMVDHLNKGRSRNRLQERM